MTASKAVDMPLLSREEDSKLWELEDWYPPLRPPQTLKEEINEDFTEVDKNARAKLDSPKDSFDKLVQHLTSHLSSDLHKLRAIFVWMGAQNIGCRQQGASCEDNNSPEYYLQEAFNDNRFIERMFAKMCRFSRIPCILVNGKAKDASYEPGDVEMKEYTWAVVYVANSWRFVFPRWAFFTASDYQMENLMLIKHSEKPTTTRLTANVGTMKPTFDEFYFLTDPEVMNYFCHPHDQDKQLLTEPWTQEKFFELPFFSNYYFSSGWKLISPLTCVIQCTTGCCLIDMLSPGIDYKLTYKMVFDEIRSGSEFPQEIQMDLYVTIIRRTQQTDSFLVRPPVTGTYKFEVMGVHGDEITRLVTFRIVCDNASPDTQPLPSRPENGFGFGEAAAEAGLSEPSHTEGVVPVKSGDEICINFKVRDDVDISARLIHFTRMSEELRDSITEKRGDDHPTKNLPFHEEAWVSVGKDDAEMLEKVASRDERADIKDPMLDKRIRAKETSYERMVEKVCVTAQEGNLDEINQTLERCEAANLHNKEDIQDAKKILVTLFQEEMEKAVESNNLEEIHACLNKIDNTCVSEMAREQAWFAKGEEEIRRRAQTLRKKDEATGGRLPDHVNDVIVAAFILIGESEEELDTWQKVNAKLKETNEEQLINKVNDLESLSITGELVDHAEQKLKGARGTFADYRSIETLKKQCLEKITFYRTKGILKKSEK